ncbi:hypothetical protein ACFWPA_11475 [Rhodococcus sp. NPDC058505]|uniref:hypothetical protein n=1 Tax=unclassified Rhodococcus (in: high G+C Gram-positive bacteria) TaxID=192944 RepID=UPI00365193BE
MTSTPLRSALVAAAATPLLLAAPAPATAAPLAPPPGPVHPVVLIGQQHADPLAAFLACAPAGIVPLFGPNVIFPICLA